MLEKNFRNEKRQVLVYIVETKAGSDNEESDGSYKEDGNSNHSALTSQGKVERTKEE